MPTDRIPLVGSFNQRGLVGNADLVANLDQRFLNCSFDVVQNPVTEKTALYVQRRPGWSVDSLVAAGSASTGMLMPQSFNATISAFGDTNSTIYHGSISVGVITGRALYFTETIISNVTYVMIKSSDGTGWYYANGSKDDLTYIGDTHIGTAVIDSLDDTTGIYIGQAWAGTGVAAGARVLTVDSATQITLNANSSADGTDITFTKTPIAKILDADFITAGTYVSRFAEMDGFLFYTTSTAATIWNSDLNSVTSYSATGFKSPNMSPDPPVAIERSGNAVVVLGAASKEVFYNAGLATGSPLQRSAQYFQRIGTLDQRSVTTIEDNIYFVSTPHEGDLGVFRITGLQAERVSTPAVDRIIGTAAVNGAIYATSFRLGGHPYAAFIVSTASDGPASDLLLESGDMILQEDDSLILLEDTPGQVASFVRMLVYNALLKVWSEWDCSQATFVDGAAASTANQLLATSRFQTGGYVYTINPAANGDVWQDAGSTYTTEIRTSRIDHGTAKRKFVQRIRLVSDQQSAGTVSLYFSDDNYLTWQGPFTMDLTQPRPMVGMLGSYEGGRAYKLVHAYNGPFRAEAMEIDYTVEA